MKLVNQYVNKEITFILNKAQELLSVKNILMWSGSENLSTLSLNFPNAFILDIESSAENYSAALDVATQVAKGDIKYNSVIEYQPVQVNMSGEKNMKDYLLAPAKIPHKFDIIIITEFEQECLQYSKNYSSGDTLIAVITNKANEINNISKFSFYKNDIPNSNTSLVWLSANSGIIESIKNSTHYTNKLNKEKYAENLNMELFERPKLSVLFIHKYNPNFLNKLYEEVVLHSLSYKEQLKFLLSAQHLHSDYFSHHFSAQGYKVGDLICNCEELQATWQREKDYTVSKEEIMYSQVREFSPDVIFINEPEEFSTEEIALFRNEAKVIAAYSNNAFDVNIISDIDILFTGSINIFPNSYRNKIAELPYLFDERCNSSAKNYDLRNNEIKLLCSPVDTELIVLFSEAFGIENICISDFNYINQSGTFNQITQNVFSDKLYKMMSDTKIILASDIEKLKEINSEVTAEAILGCGALLITKFNDNLSRNFETGKDISSYSSPQEAILLCKYFSQNIEDAQKTAESGKYKIDKSHTYDLYIKSMVKELEKIMINKSANQIN